MSIDKRTADALSREIESLLKTHFATAPTDLTVRWNGGSYDAFTLRPRIEITATAYDGTTKEQADFVKYAPMFGLDPAAFGKTFETHGRTFKLVGLKPGSPKFAVLAAEVPSGRIFKFTAGVLNTKFGATVPDFLMWHGR